MAAVGEQAPAAGSHAVSAAAPSDRLPHLGDEICAGDRKYRLHSILGDGGYGTVFMALIESERKVAVKCEKYSKSMLHIEINVLRHANEKKCKHICEMIDYGSMKPDYVFVVMSLLGKDLHRLRSEQPDRRFTFSTAIRASIQALQAIQELHKCGFISRDIKPGNFAPGLKVNNRQNKIIYLYDFGLARRYVDKNNNIIPSRKEVGWRGTTRYGSLQAHQRQDLSRRDDLESWLYMLVEVTKGTLPWRLITDRAAVQNAKQLARGNGRVQFLYECPKQYEAILSQVDEMKFETSPDYDKLYALLDAAREDKGIRMSEHWDWEDDTHSTTASVSQASSMSDREQVAKQDDSNKEVKDKDKGKAEKDDKK